MRKRIITIIAAGLILTGCAETEVGSNQWTSFNANHEDAHVYYAFTDYSFYSDGSFFSNEMYEAYQESKEVKED